MPPAPPFPEEIHGQKMCGVVWCCDRRPGPCRTKALAVVNEPGPPGLPLHGADAVSRWCSRCSTSLMPAGSAVVLARGLLRPHHGRGRRRARRIRAANLPTGLSTMHLYPVDGAAAPGRPRGTRRGPTGTPCGRAIIAGIDPDPANAEAHQAVVRGLLGGAAPPLDGRRLRELHGHRREARTGSGPPTATTTTGSRTSSGPTTPTTSSTPTRTSGRRPEAEPQPSRPWPHGFGRRWSPTASYVALSALRALSRCSCATPTNRQSMTVSWAILLAVAPERNVVSGATVVSRWSLT